MKVEKRQSDLSLKQLRAMIGGSPHPYFDYFRYAQAKGKMTVEQEERLSIVRKKFRLAFIKAKRIKELKGAEGNED